MKTFALYNLKGGVGKTSSCVNLAYTAAKEGHKTLIWDMDPQSSSTFYLAKKSKLKGGLESLLKKESSIEDVIKKTDYENLFVIPSELKSRDVDLMLEDLKKPDNRLKKVLSDIKKEFDFVFIDCPPMLTLLTENIFNTADVVIFPMIPSTLSERTYHQVLDFFTDNKYKPKKIVPFFNMVDLRRKLHKETIEKFSKGKYNCLNTVIPNSSFVEKMGLHQSPIAEYSPTSKPAKAFLELWKEIKGLV